MKKNLRFLFRVQSARMGHELINPVNSLLELIGSVCYFFLHMVSFSLIISKFSFPGWSVGEMWVLLFTFQVFTYAAFYLFWKGLIHTVRDINRGVFDHLLTKPISSRLITFFRSGGLHNFVCFILGLISVFVSIYIFKLTINPLSVLIYFLTLIISLWIFHSFTVIFISLNFFFGYIPTTSSVMFGIQEIYKYPTSLYNHAGIWAWLTVIPFSFFTTIPTTQLLLRPLQPVFLAGYIVFFILSWLLSEFIWRFSVNHYSSSGS